MGITGTGRTARRVILIVGRFVPPERPMRDTKRVYGHTQQYSAPARPLYDAVAHATTFVVYER